MTYAYKLPRRFELFDRVFVHDNIFAWYGHFEDENILVCITETDGESINNRFSITDRDFNASKENIVYLATIYHFDDIIGMGLGKSPLLACIDAKILEQLDAINTMNSFMDTLTGN